MIEEIKNRVNIIDVALNAGLNPDRNGFIKSIYKDEKTPSLKIYEDTNSYYDYSTKKGGDVINFYADIKGITVKDAIKELTQAAGIYDVKKNNIKAKNYFKGDTMERIELTQSEQESYNERMRLIRAFDENDYKIAINKIHNDILEERSRIQRGIFKDFKDFCNGIGNRGYEYLTGKDRGLTAESITKAGIFEIKDLRKTIDYLMDSYSMDMLIVSGLFNKNCKFVFWNHHIIIPYYESKKIVWLRGRVNPLFTRDKKMSKYISVTNFATNLTAKRFYNIDSIEGIDKDADVIICEGEFDTIRTAQEGYITIGIPGVNGVPENAKEILKSYEIYLGFDSDVAGMEAAQTFTNMLGREVNYLFLKNSKDLTEYLNESR